MEHEANKSGLPQAPPGLLLIGGPPYFAETSSPRKLLAKAWRRLGGRVLYVELGGEAAPYRQRAQAASGEAVETVEAEPKLHVLRLSKWPAVPWSYPDALRRFHLERNLPRVQRALEEAGLGAGSFVALYYGWYWAEWVEKIQAAAHVYDCVDEHRAYPHIAGKPARECYVWKTECRLIEKVDLLAVPSPVLLEERAARARAALLLPHAVDAEAYAACLDGALPEPEDLSGWTGRAGRAHPRALLMGNLQPKLDFGLAADLAAGQSAWRVALLGPKEKGARLPPNTANLRWLGKKPYARLPAYLAHVQVGLVPLLPTPYNRASAPLKLLEYLAAGLPVAASRNPVTEGWADKCPDFVRVADGGREWFAACEEARAAGERFSRAEIHQAVAGHTYEARVKTLLQALNEKRKTAGGGRTC